MGPNALEFSFRHMELHYAALGNFVLFSLRYVVMAGIVYWLLWHRSKDRAAPWRIYPKLPETGTALREAGWSFLSILVFSLLAFPVLTLFRRGWSNYYFHVEEFGWWYFSLSVAGLVIAHDTYFYWCHRFMHWKPVYDRVHAVHHYFVRPSPVAAFAFHPGEAFLEAIIFSCIPLIVPVHPYAIVIVLTYMTTMNILGHLGHEFYPAGFTKHWFGRWHNTTTHHAMHHRYSRCNYGLYFNFWDWICGTNHPAYHDQFERNVARRNEQRSIVSSGEEVLLERRVVPFPDDVVDEVVMDIDEGQEKKHKNL